VPGEVINVIGVAIVCRRTSSARDGGSAADLAPSGLHQPRAAINSALQKDRKNTQRERILAGVIDAVAHEGHGAATVAQVVKSAGVSRPTFYDYFTDKNHAFVAALEAIQERAFTEVRQALAEERPDRAMHALAAGLVAFAGAWPAGARVLLDEALRGEARALDTRDQGIRTLAALIEARERSARSPGAPDLAARAWIGGLYRLLASRLRDGQTAGEQLLEELLAWTDGYALALREHRWRALIVSLHTAPVLTDSPLQAPPSPGVGRTRLSRRELAENHRQRILLAAAQLAERKGYPASTVADITKLARIDNRAFYRQFADKQEAFQALHELLFRQIMAATATGFLTGASWPERVWEAARAFTRYLEQNPTLAHAALVDSHSGSGEMVGRVEQLVGGFTIFLQEGYQYNRSASAPSPIALQATAATVFELYYLQLRESRRAQLFGLVPHVTFVALSPFIGVAAANELIDRKLDGLLASRPPRPSGAKPGSRFNRAGATKTK
jgi:AcrR family transcriptional regulator